SRILVMGPDSALAPLIAAVVLPLAAGSGERAIALGGMMALITGLICVLAGLARLGFITELLSKPIRYGYMNGIALTVLVSQLPKLFGFSVDGAGLVGESMAFLRALVDGAPHWPTLLVGGGPLRNHLVRTAWRQSIGLL